MNLILPGSAQVALGRPMVAVVLSGAFGLTLGAAVVDRWVAPGLLGFDDARVLWLAAASAWGASQVLMVLGLRRAARPAEEGESEGLREIARLWLCGHGDRARALAEVLLERRPAEPALHYVTALLLADSPGRSRKDALGHLAAAEGCDESGRWQETLERERERLGGRGRFEL